ncbi:DNA (cytosine-5-)-methyltransferase [Flavobacterium sp. NST-5]|uniref:DNA (cytosine-5-)-methyltransferase n=1 Tax=Flavobacterium ichthyis TaxID=2698827 RepID=A0ABW9Z733_9FLAO|nr:DNA cytosine methyltransferase [Flavobacterium ichthyis]NBL64372.1 DNA (cytosine-5-)-methyltransferase [Flavobacterium ichthyis]
MRFNAIDIFSGAGGMSLGAIMAGIEIDIAVENNQSAANTFKANHPETDVICDDIKKVNSTLLSTKKDYFALFGGPPCQGFSISNTKTRNEDNSNNSLFNEFIRLVDELKPTWFVFENVEGIVSFGKGKVLSELRERFKELGYKINDGVLLASDYGVPQKRNRFFMVGNMLDVDFTFPEKHKKKVNIKQAISDLPSLQNGTLTDELPYKKGGVSEYAKLMRENSKIATQNYVSRNKDYVIERYRYIGVGENWQSIPPELMTNYSNISNCHSGIYRRLHPEQPSVVIANYRKNMLIHPFENRGLSVREAARIQSFPDDFVFKGTLSEQQQQIGNAVPPLLAKAIFDQIIKLTKEKLNEQTKSNSNKLPELQF